MTELHDIFTLSKMVPRHTFTMMMWYFLAELEAKGANAEVITQRANLPDTNLLDLGFFWAVQSAKMMKYWKERVR